MVTLANLEKFIEKGHGVTVIGPSEHHYYSGMGPGMLGKSYRPEEIRFATKHVVEKKGGTFICDKVQAIDPQGKQLTLASGKTVAYDVVSFNSGSHVSREMIFGDDSDIYSVKPIERLMEAQQRLETLMKEKEIHVAIVGGGPSSAEIAGNVWQLANRLKNEPRGHRVTLPRITIFAGKSLMPRFPEKVRKMVIDCLTRRDIQIDTNGYVKHVEKKNIVSESGRRHPADLIFMASGVEPSTMFQNAGLPTGPDKGLLVNRYLQCTTHPEIFGGGDCIHFKERPLDRVGVYAVRENPILFHNLMAALEETPLQPFDPGGDYLLIFNLGGEYGVLKKRWFSMKGKAAFVIKDLIDRKFMKEFQAIE